MKEMEDKALASLGRVEKWRTEQTELKIGDYVAAKNENPLRGGYDKGVVRDVVRSRRDRLVRTVVVAIMANGKESLKSMPVNKLVLLEKCKTD